MKAVTVHELKSAIAGIPPSQQQELLLRLARYKKDNKELLTYLLFEADDEEGFIAGIKKEIDEGFESMNTSNVYYSKKTIRKVLRTINKYIRYSGKKQTSVELLIYFCRAVKLSEIDMEKSTALSNLYKSQLKKINDAMDELHEDIQYDLRKEMEVL